MRAWLGGGRRDWQLSAMRDARHPCYLGSFHDPALVLPLSISITQGDSMKAWMAGAESREYQRGLSDVTKLSLQSFVYLKERPDMIDPSKFIFFLDSGAYSAWSRGTVIDLDEYCAFIKANIEHIEVYASLDVIPGVHGGIATPKQRDEAAEQSWANYLYMRREGLDPLPVFHYGEDFRHLERMLDYGCDYIGIGGLVAVPGDKRRTWLDRLFTRITDENGHPIIKTHGFGMTAVPLIFRYPWYSIDSTTWIQVTANGAVYLPAMVNGEFVFDQIPSVISVSARNPKQSSGGKAGNTLAPSMRKILDRWLEQCGKTYAEVEEHYYHRAVVNVSFFKRVSEAKAGQVFKPEGARKQALFT